MDSAEMYGWHNFVTGEIDYVSAGGVSDYRPYIPQIPAAQGMYTCLMKMGKTPAEAASEVLNACITKQEAE